MDHPASAKMLAAAARFNSLSPGRYGCNLKWVILKLIWRIDILKVSCQIALMWMQQHFTDDQSTLFLVMAWCCQAARHYLSQWWPRSISPYCITRPQWDKSVSYLITLFICEYCNNLKTRNGKYLITWTDLSFPMLDKQRLRETHNSMQS